MERFLDGDGDRARRARARTLETMVENLADKPLRVPSRARTGCTRCRPTCAAASSRSSRASASTTTCAPTIFEPLQMRDTGLHRARRRDRPLRRQLPPRRPTRQLKLLDDPGAEHATARSRRSCPAAAAWCRTTDDYLRFAQMLAQRRRARRRAHPRPQDRRADGDQPPARRRRAAAVRAARRLRRDRASTASASASRWPSASARPRPQAIGSPGDFYWGGAASTIFWVDPAEDLVVVFMTQLMPSGTFNFRGQLKSLVYPAIVD